MPGMPTTTLPEWMLLRRLHEAKRRRKAMHEELERADDRVSEAFRQLQLHQQQLRTTWTEWPQCNTTSKSDEWVDLTTCKGPPSQPGR